MSDNKNIAELMANTMCIKCANYKKGCTPAEVVACTKEFINALYDYARAESC